jgi:hypothetical protein
MTVETLAAADCVSSGEPELGRECPQRCPAAKDAARCVFNIDASDAEDSFCWKFVDNSRDKYF